MPNTRVSNTNECRPRETDQVSPKSPTLAIYTNMASLDDEMPGWEYPREKVHIEKIVGKGAFCVVAKAFAEGFGIVAVKIPKGTCNMSTNTYSRQQCVKAVLHKAIFLVTCLATMTTEKHCKLQRGCHTFAIFFATHNVSTGNCLQLEISCEQKTGSDCLIFTKLRCRFRWTCHTQDISTFLATRNATFGCRCGLQNGGVTHEIFLATCLATFFAR